MRVVVIGAGFAGLAAAIRLQERRHRVTLIERRGVLGGRTCSYRDAATGDEVDNGSHLLIGACSETLALLHRAGLDGFLQPQANLQLDFVDRRGFTSLACPPWIAPLHLAAGLLGLRLPWSARLSALRLGLMIRLRPAREETLASYLERVGQSPLSRRLLWDPLATAILNEDPERADARLFRRVFTEAFLRSARASALVFTRCGWGTLAERLGRHFEGRDGIVRRHALVTRIEVGNGRAIGVRARGRPMNAGRDGVSNEREFTLTADAVVAAVPWHVLPSLLPPEIAARPQFAALYRLASSPIVSLDIWLDRPVVPHLLIGLRESQLQWVFDKGRLHGRPGPPQHLSFIMSAARRSLTQSKSQLVCLAQEALRLYFPSMAKAQIVRSLVLREPHATFVCSPEAEALRPETMTSLPGLLLAGDWTSTGLPATIEGAVRSGLRAAASVER